MPPLRNSAAEDGKRRLAITAVSLVVLAPYLLLLVLSLGRGWTFPNLLPDRVDLEPYQRLVSERDGLLRAMGRSLVMSVAVGLVSTVAGLLIGRSVRHVRSHMLPFLMYVPFVVSPVVIGICLYDLFVRLQLSGTFFGVAAAQSIAATSFASVFFSEMWSEHVERRELLVRQLGGNAVDVWRHAVSSQMGGLILICFVQTGLYSWLDYGLVSILGGGHVPTVTTRVFAYIREASVNQAALSGLILSAPPLAGIVVCATIFRRRHRTHQQASDVD